jgi:hypothetical protein
MPGHRPTSASLTAWQRQDKAGRKADSTQAGPVGNAVSAVPRQSVVFEDGVNDESEVQRHRNTVWKTG